MNRSLVALCALAFSGLVHAAPEEFALRPLFCKNQNPDDQPSFFILKPGTNTEWAIHNRQGRVWLVVPFSLDDTFRTVNDYPSFSKFAKGKLVRGNGLLTTERVLFHSEGGDSGYVIEEEFLFTPNMDTAYNLSQAYTLGGTPAGRSNRVYSCQDLTPELDTTMP